MLERNVKTNLSALQVFYSLEVKMSKGECGYDYIWNNSFGVRCPEIGRNITICLESDSKMLEIVMCPSLKRYKQVLADDEYEDVKKRMIKLCQNAQDKFEKWVIE